MTWHLKDKQLEEKLIGLCSVFLEKLNYGVYLKREDENYILVSFDREKSGNCLEGNELWFWIDELEEVHEYNPNTWNEYPKVIPPKNVVMRCEIYTERYDTDTPEPKGGKLVARTSAVWNGHSWDFSSLNYVIPDNWTIRFRPWED